MWSDIVCDAAHRTRSCAGKSDMIWGTVASRRCLSFVSLRLDVFALETILGAIAVGYVSLLFDRVVAPECWLCQRGRNADMFDPWHVERARGSSG